MRELTADELIYEGTIHRREKREAKIGEKVQIIAMPNDPLDTHDYTEDYKYGDIVTVVDVGSIGVDIDRKWSDGCAGNVYIYHREYEVIVPVS